jgi:hypothetical protein
VRVTSIGPAYTGVVRALILTTVLALAGCSAHTNVRIGGGSQLASPGTSISTSSLGIRVQSGSAAAALIGLGVVAAAVHGGEREGYGVRYRANPLLAIQPTDPAAQPDPSRRVHEQDCSRPIEDASANLRCR